MSMLDHISSDTAAIFGDFAATDVALDGRRISGQFFAPSERLDVAEGSIMSTRPELHILATDLGSAGEGSSVKVNYANYTVLGPPINSGLGRLVLMLREA